MAIPAVPNFPTSLDDATSLPQPPGAGETDQVQNTLQSAMDASQTTLALVSATDFGNRAGIILIDNELIEYGGRSTNNLTGLIRGQRGTLAATHSAGAVVRLVISGLNIANLRQAVIELEKMLLVGSTPHTHAGTGANANPLAAAGLASDAVITAKILDRNVTDRKLSLGVLSAFDDTTRTIAGDATYGASTDNLITFTPPVVQSYLVLFGVNVYNSGTVQSSALCVVSLDDDTPANNGATDIARNIEQDVVPGSKPAAISRAIILTSLSAVQHTLRLKYRVGDASTTANFRRRFIIAIPIGA